MAIVLEAWVNTWEISPQLSEFTGFSLIRDGPSDRRKWLDLLLSASSVSYFNFLQGYTRAPARKKCFTKKEASDGELLAFEKPLQLMQLNYTLCRQAIPQISKTLTQSYLSLTDDQEQADIVFSADLYIDSVDEYLDRLIEERLRDRIMGSTRKGPHRDDFVFQLQQRDARIYASEGQQRGLVLALRLAEFSYLRNALGRIPQILADDVLGELDKVRKANFRKLLPPDAQVFATGTAYPAETESAIWETFEVNAGTFIKA